MNFKYRFSRVASIVIAGFLALLILSCGYSDARNLPTKIKVNAVNIDGYHAHASLLFYPTNPIKFACTGIFGEGLKTKESIFSDISEAGVDFQIKKKLPGICGYQFAILTIECSKSKSYSTNVDPPPEYVPIGILDTTIGEATYQGNVLASSNRILNNFLHIEVNGKKSRFWGCKDDCENKEDFGINSSNQTLTINCQDGK